jgi:outer membrane protein OmpA-like peptidoglycan-associated protein
MFLTLPFELSLDPVARAKNAFFACLLGSVSILLFVDLYLGPSAFAVPPPSPAFSATAATAPATEATVTSSPPPQAPTSPPSLPSATPTSADAGEDSDARGHISGVVATFEFEHANADLEKLKLLAKQMHADTSSDIVLEGHSDPSGNEYKNLSLSLDRANWCADRLVEYGVNRMRIRTVGLGSARPIIDVGGDAGAVNRRVEVRWVVKSADGGRR